MLALSVISQPRSDARGKVACRCSWKAIRYLTTNDPVRAILKP